MVRVWVVDENIFKNRVYPHYYHTLRFTDSDMSRAPAPMKIETTPSTTTDASNMNPYGMQTYSMMPNGANHATDSPLNTMQNMYGNMQQQQQMQQQMQQPQQGYQHSLASPMHQHSYPPNTQNVSVVDFKPDIMAQQHMAQMQQKYQQQMSHANSAPAPNTLGLVGPDGRYMPATAAAGSYMGPDHPDRFSNSKPQHYDPYMDTDSRMNHYSGMDTHSRMNRSRDLPSRRTNTVLHRNTLSRASTLSSAGMRHAEMNRRGADVASSVRNMPRRNIEARATSRYNTEPEASPMVSSKAITDLVDERIKTAASAASAVKEASNVSNRAVSDMIDERLRAANTASSASSAPTVTASDLSHMIDQKMEASKIKTGNSSRKIKDIVDERMDKVHSKYTAAATAAAAATASATTVSNPVGVSSGFYTKPKDEQRRIVGNAVREVMSGYNTPTSSSMRANKSTDRSAYGRYNHGG
jgi:hypothetical protein